MAEVFRAGSGETTPGEERALAILQALPSDWTVIANKILAFGATNSYEIDFIIIAPHRIIILDEKSYRGSITGTDEVWSLSGGDSRRSPFGKMEMVARKLAGLLERKVTGFPAKRNGVVPVIGGVILSDDTANAQIHDLRARRCLLTTVNAVEKLTWLDKDAAEADFELSAIRPLIRKTLYDDNSARRPRRPDRVGLFTIEDEVDERDGCRVYRGRNDQGAVRLLYVYPQAASNEPSSQALDRDLAALNLLQDSGVVPFIGEPFPWQDDEYRVVPVHLQPGSAVGATARQSARSRPLRLRLTRLPRCTGKGLSIERCAPRWLP